MVFLSNWMVMAVIAAAVVGDEEVLAYPLAGDFALQFDGNEKLFFTGGSKDFASNVTLYHGSNSYNAGDTSDIFIKKTGTYYAEMDVCGDRYKTSNVTVSAVTEVEELAQSHTIANTNSSYGYSISMNKTGDRLAIATYNSALNIYHKSGGTWSSVFSYTAASLGEFGFSCEMSGDGNTVVTGNRGWGFSIFKYSGSSWSLSVNKSKPSGTGSEYGYKVSTNYDGTRIVVNDRGITLTDIWDLDGAGSLPSSQTHRISGSTSSGHS